jgi:hypothetical protein
MGLPWMFVLYFMLCCPERKKGEERVGVGGRGKYPGAPPHKGKKRKKPTARYLIDQYGEKGKAKKKKKNARDNVEIGKWIQNFVRKSTKYCTLAISVTSLEFTYFDLPPTVAVHA